jgi:Ca2+/Na+ antiporter
MKRLFTRHHNYIFLLIIIVFSIALISITLYNNKYKLNRDISKLNLFNIDTLIIVSHPSDETIWASSTLIDENCLVVCISYQNNKETKENKEREDSV